MSKPNKTRLGNLGADYGAVSKTIEWETPQYVFDALHKEFDFTLDVCATPDNAKCEKYFTIKEDGLKQPWKGRCWMNPPYGRDISAWVEKAVQSQMTTAELVVGLLPVRADTKWFHHFVLPNAEIRFIKGRLKFGGFKAGAAFASMVCVWRNLDVIPVGMWGEEFEVKSVDYKQEKLNFDMDDEGWTKE